MRIVVHEFVNGGGLAGQEVLASLAREGSAMLGALLADLAAIRCHQIVTTADARFPPVVPPGVEIVTLSPTSTTRAAQLDSLIASADAVWFIAPETAGCLEGLALCAERHETFLLGSDSETIRRASDKGAFPRRLARQGVTYPTTRVMRWGTDWQKWKEACGEIGYPVVVKPRRGAGCDGVCLARDVRELRRGVDTATEASERESLLLQRFVAGVPASVSLLADGRQAMPLAVNSQSVRVSRPFRYDGGTTPFYHPGVERAVDAALRTCKAFPGLRGFVGVDLVLTDSEAVVIEVNPRLTTAYLGARSAIDGNVAALAIAACGGILPAFVTIRQQVRFTSAGQIVSAAPTSH